LSEISRQTVIEFFFIQLINQVILFLIVNWRDEKVAVVIFNRDVKKFSDVIDSATKAVDNHKLCLKHVGNRKDTSFSFIFRNPEGGMNAKKYIGLTKTSKATATRDMQQLLEIGAFVLSGKAGGRSTSYQVNI
jgi:Fic family protein